MTHIHFHYTYTFRQSYKKCIVFIIWGCAVAPPCVVTAVLQNKLSLVELMQHKI